MIRRGDRRRPSHDRWLISYADFITLLFALFVVLYAASQTNKNRGDVAESIDSALNALGIFSGVSNDASNGAASSNGSMNVVMGEDLLTSARVKDDLEHLGRELQQTLSKEVASHSVSIQMGRDGLVVSLREAGFFASGSATPEPQTLDTMRQIAATLSHTPYDLRIEGHTDNVPIHNAEFNSNWELSTARATSIARILLDLKAIPPERLSAAGYAEFHPVAGNDSPEGRAQNRRVDLVVQPRSKIDFSQPSSSSPSTGAWRKITDEE